MSVTVSIIIPIYNRSSLIKPVIDAILKQTFSDFELIVVDDFSDDSEKLKDALASYENLNYQYIRHEKNMHGGAARNTGILNSKGKFIAFLDSDDFWHERKLELCIDKNIKENEIIYSKVKDRGKVSPSIAYKDDTLIDEYLLVYNGSMQTSSLFMHREFSLKIMFDPTLKRFQDFDFIIRAGKIYNANFVFINMVAVNMGEEDRLGRISSSVDFEPAFFWLDKISPFLSDKSKSVFVFNRAINYASNTLSRYEMARIFIKYKCYMYLKYLNKKVFLKIILGKNQKWFKK